MGHLGRGPDGKNICFRLDPSDDATAFQRRGAIAVVPEALTQRVGGKAHRLINLALLDAETEDDVIIRPVMDKRCARFKGLLRIDDNRQLFVVDHNGIESVLRPMAILGHNDRHRFTEIVNLSLCQSRRSGTLQYWLYPFQPCNGMNLEAFRKRRYPAFDLLPRPYSNDAVETESLLDINAMDSGVRVI